MKNLAEGLKKEQLEDIAQIVIDGYETDDSTRTEFKEMHKEALKLSALIREKKTEPWPGCSNVALPMLSTAILQFHSNSLPLILPSKGSFKASPILKSADAKDAAERKAEYMEDLYMRRSTQFSESYSKAMMKLPLEGTVIQKVYYDPIDKAVISDWVSPIDFVINNKARYIEKCERYTHVLYETETTVKKKMKSGYYIKVDEARKPGNPEYINEEEYDQQADKNSGHTDVGEGDGTTPRKILEQYIYLEPKLFGEKGDSNDIKKQYVVTVDIDTREVLRAVNNYNDTLKKPFVPFVKTTFIENPSGFYGIGFGALITGTNKAMNAMVNALVDSAALQNQQCGFVDKAFNAKRGGVEIKMGKFVEIDGGDDIRKKIREFKFGAPSQTLMQMIQLLKQFTDQHTTITAFRHGEMARSGTSATAQVSSVEQGQKVFSTIFTGIHRSLSKVISSMHDYLAHYLNQEDYFKHSDIESMMGNPQEGQTVPEVDAKATLVKDWTDFHGVALVSDPNITSRQEKIGKAEFVYKTALENPVTNQKPEAVKAALKNLYKTMDVDDDLIDSILKEDQPQPLDLPQGEENEIFMADGIINALETQDHMTHLDVIDEFINIINIDPVYADSLTAEGKKNLDVHRRQHLAFKYRQESAEDEAMAQQPQQAPQQGGV